MDTLEAKIWYLHFVQVLPRDDDDPLLVRAIDALSSVAGNTERVGRPFLLDGRGAPHSAFNAFFASRRMRNRAASTNRKYAFALRVWLNFLELRGVSWDAATDDDLFDYKFWRRTDEANPRRVGQGRRGVTTCRPFPRSMIGPSGCREPPRLSVNRRILFKEAPLPPELGALVWTLQVAEARQVAAAVRGRPGSGLLM